MNWPRNVFICMTSEADFVKALVQETCEIDGIQYCAFHWTMEYQEDQEPVRVPVWIFLPRLTPNFFHESFLQSITAPIGWFLKRDNPTKCVTRTDGARV